MDDKGGHILIDNDFNITGIIDWNFARIVPAYKAFRPSLVTADMDTIFSGRVGLSEYDYILASAVGKGSGSEVLGLIARSTDRIHRFTFVLGMGMALCFQEVLAVFNGIARTFNEGMEFNWEQWSLGRVRKWADDNVLAKLIQDDDEKGKSGPEGSSADIKPTS
ncbi:hypothetical protein VTI74DRAFT_8115 [Chaetomium olivicolor]